jgi:hypothetical protein
MRFIPTAKQLSEKLKLVEVTVHGEFIARIDDKRKTSKGYKLSVFVPEKFNKGDLKRATPRALAEKYPGEFVSMRTFEQVGAPKKSDKTALRSSIYSAREIERFAKLRKEMIAAASKKRTVYENGILVEDSSDVDPNTGLPPVINDGPEEE